MRSSNLFLSESALTEMTGYKSKAGQIRWLAKNAYRFDVRADGRPNVLIEQVMERQCRNAKTKAGPNLAYLKSVS